MLLLNPAILIGFASRARTISTGASTHLKTMQFTFNSILPGRRPTSPEDLRETQFPTMKRGKRRLDRH